MQVYAGVPILTNQSPARLVAIWPLDARGLGRRVRRACARGDRRCARGRAHADPRRWHRPLLPRGTRGVACSTGAGARSSASAIAAEVRRLGPEAAHALLCATRPASGGARARERPAARRPRARARGARALAGARGRPPLGRATGTRRCSSGSTCRRRSSRRGSTAALADMFEAGRRGRGAAGARRRRSRRLRRRSSACARSPSSRERRRSPRSPRGHAAMRPTSASGCAGSPVSACSTAPDPRWSSQTTIAAQLAAERRE